MNMYIWAVQECVSVRGLPLTLQLLSLPALMIIHRGIHSSMKATINQPNTWANVGNTIPSTSNGLFWIPFTTTITWDTIEIYG